MFRLVLAAFLLAAAPAHASTLRIVILGDSVARGAGDERGLGIGGNLVRELAARGVVAEVVNAAVNGSRTWQMARVLRSAATREAVRAADVIVVSIGGNDLFGDQRAQLMALVTPQLAMRLTMVRMKTLVATMRHLNSDARLFLLGLYNPYRGSAIGRAIDPSVGLWSGRLFATFASESNVSVLPIADLFSHRHKLSTLDRFHPSADGYALIARRIADAL